MFRSAVERLDPLAVPVVRDGVGEVAALALDDLADALALVVVHAPGPRLGLEAADLEDDHDVAVVVDGELRVGRLAVVLVAEAAADAQDLRRQVLLAGPPAAHVHLVDALVADVAV